MSSVLFVSALKKDASEAFKQFVKDTAAEKSVDWKDMLARYDMSSVRIWLGQLEGRDYVFVAHDVGDDFAEKIKLWDQSEHPFDQWFNKQIMSVYDSQSVDSMAAPAQLLEMAV